MFAVVVTFQIDPAQASEFLGLVTQNAATSLEVEADCHRFDVCTDPATPNEVFLYELYTDRAGFDAHLASPHFKTFDAAVGPMIADKHVRTYETVRS